MEQHLISWWLNHPKETPFIIKKVGQLNFTDGPDIESSIITYNHTNYQGNIEIDVNKSYWFKHGHFNHFRYQNILLHIFDKDDGYFYSEGNIPQFSYCIQTQKFTTNDRSQISKKHRLENLRILFNDDTVFWLLFARNLGYYYNRDQMMYIAHQIITQRDYISSMNSYSRAVRPRNRIDRRIDQFKLLYQNQSLFSEIKELTTFRYDYSKVTQKICGFINQHLSSELKLDNTRIIQFLYHYLIPLLIESSHCQNFCFREYLIEYQDKLSQYSIIKKYR